MRLMLKATGESGGRQPIGFGRQGLSQNGDRPDGCPEFMTHIGDEVLAHRLGSPSLTGVLDRSDYGETTVDPLPDGLSGHGKRTSWGADDVEVFSSPVSVGCSFKQPSQRSTGHDLTVGATIHATFTVGQTRIRTEDRSDLRISQHVTPTRIKHDYAERQCIARLTHDLQMRTGEVEITLKTFAGVCQGLPLLALGPPKCSEPATSNDGKQPSPDSDEEERLAHNEWSTERSSQHRT